MCLWYFKYNLFNFSGKKFSPEGIEDYGLFSRVNDTIGVLLEFK